MKFLCKIFAFYVVKTVNMVQIKKIKLDTLQKDFVTRIYGLSDTVKPYKSPIAELDEKGTLTIKKGFSWNYCTPQYEITLGSISFRSGTWNGKLQENGKPQCWEASLVHDVLYEDSDLHGITRKEADFDFLCRLLKSGFSLSYFYYIGVRIFGGKFWVK